MPIYVVEFDVVPVVDPSFSVEVEADNKDQAIFLAQTVFHNDPSAFVEYIEQWCINCTNVEEKQNNEQQENDNA